MLVPRPKIFRNSSETLSDIPLTHLAPMCHVYTPWKCKKNLCFILKSFQNNKWSQANGFFHNILTALILNISITVLNSAFFEGMFIDPKISFFSEIYGFGVTKKLGSTRLWIFPTQFQSFPAILQNNTVSGNVRYFQKGRLSDLYGTKYSRMDQVKFVEDGL